MNAHASTLLTSRDAANLRTFGYWVIALAATLIAGTYVIEARVLPDLALGWAIPAIALFLGIMTVRAYVAFIRNSDELLRKIVIEGLAWGVGAAVIFMPVYRLCERLGAPRLDSVDPLLVIILAWAIGHWRGMRRYAVAEESL